MLRQWRILLLSSILRSNNTEAFKMRKGSYTQNQNQRYKLSTYIHRTAFLTLYPKSQLQSIPTAL